MSFVKICGLTNLEDARVAEQAGADALGFVFAANSPRRITLAAARAIADQLEGRALRVGVFVETPSVGWPAALAAAGMDVAQIHGRQPVEEVAELARQARLWRALTLPATSMSQTDWQRLESCVEAFLFDAAVGGQAGGTGVRLDAALVCATAATLQPETRWILAGGLTPENVGAAIAATGARAVDVSSGVEAAPGRKDAVKIRAFIRQARSQFAAAGSGAMVR